MTRPTRLIAYGTVTVWLIALALGAGYLMEGRTTTLGAFLFVSTMAVWTTFLLVLNRETDREEAKRNG